MTAQESLIQIRMKAAEAVDDCERLISRGGIVKWEAVALRSKLDSASSAAMQLELRLIEHQAKEDLKGGE